MSDVLFELHDICKAYEQRRVLEVSHLQIFRGEIFAVVGPSGAGKSTLLRLLNFLEPPTRGSVSFQDVIYQRTKPPIGVRRRITTVFQRPMLLNRTVRANVRYGLALRGERNAKERIESVLNQVGLQEMANAWARQLSGGEQQRVALARAIVLQPDVLLLDEPTTNLDPYNVRLIEEIIKHENAERGTTIVLVTHNIFQAKRLADRAAFLLNGVFIEVAEIEPFFNSPCDRRTAAFIAGELVY